MKEQLLVRLTKTQKEVLRGYAEANGVSMNQMVGILIDGLGEKKVMAITAKDATESGEYLGTDIYWYGGMIYQVSIASNGQYKKPKAIVRCPYSSVIFQGVIGYDKWVIKECLESLYDTFDVCSLDESVLDDLTMPKALAFRNEIRKAMDGVPYDFNNVFLF